MQLKELDHDHHDHQAHDHDHDYHYDDTSDDDEATERRHFGRILSAFLSYKYMTKTMFERKREAFS